MEKPVSSAERPILLQSPLTLRRRRRNFLVRRLSFLFAVSLAAFSFTTWNLVRMEMPAQLPGDSSGPAGIVRSHLDAIARGDLQAAYALFSQKYRAKVPFSTFHQLIAEHPSMFHAERMQVDSRDASSHRAVLDVHVLARDGQQYLARYALVLLQGRWWIDDVHWSREDDSHGSTTAVALRYRHEAGIGFSHRKSSFL